MDFIQAMKISGTALTAQRAKLNVISENLANNETTRTEDGGPYRRKMVVFSQGRRRPLRRCSGRAGENQGWRFPT